MVPKYDAEQGVKKWCQKMVPKNCAKTWCQKNGVKNDVKNGVKKWWRKMLSKN